jgi:hypothetical protein
MSLKYPVYVISKGRAGHLLTTRALDKCGVPYRVVVEPQEAEAYAQFYSRDRLIITPFSNLGEGSIPVRNFVWQHSIAEGHVKHWILDDNIENFNRLNRNTKYVVHTDATFRACEDFTDMYSNVAMSGMNYYSFAKSTDPVPPFTLNTRVYSCILLRNDMPQRWRGKYNEDTDLSIRFLKAGWCTLLFNAFLCGKVTTLRMAGGNTGEVYGGTDNRREFAESLREQHPDITKVVWRFKRWHHQVDYRGFTTPLIKASPAPALGEYSMSIKRPHPKEEEGEEREDRIAMGFTLDPL